MVGGIFLGFAVIFVSAYVARIIAADAIEKSKTKGEQLSKNDEKALKLMKQWDNLFAYNGNRQDEKEEINEKY